MKIFDSRIYLCKSVYNRGDQTYHRGPNTGKIYEGVGNNKQLILIHLWCIKMIKLWAGPQAIV